MEERIPVISGLGKEQIKDPQNEKQQYYIKYLNGLIELKDIPIEMYSSQILELSAKRNPKEFIDIIFKLVRAKIINVNILAYVKLFPSEYQTQEVYNMIFSIRPEYYYKLMPKKFKTKEMAEELMKINPKNIRIISVEHRTKEYYYEGFESSDKIWFLKVIPNEYKTKKMCVSAMEYNPECFEYVPDEFKDWDMCLKALDYNPEFFELVPERFIDETLCAAAFYGMKGPKIKIFKLIPDAYKTEKMCEIIFEENSENLKFIPNAYKTKKMCRSAMKYNPECFEYIPDEFKDWDMCINAVDHNPEFFKLVPERLIEETLCGAAFYGMKGPKIENFKLIPDEYKTEKMCEIIFNENVESFKLIPNIFKTEEMCITVLRKNFMEYAEFVPKKLINNEITKITLIELKHLISIRKTIKLEGELLEYIVNSYPNLLNAFDRKSIQKIILREVYLIIENVSTLEMIQRKYGITKEYLEETLERIKKNDFESYQKIEEAMNDRKNEKNDTILKDIYNLEIIISLLGEIKNDNLTKEQRIKFAYLNGKYIVNSLVDIHSYYNEHNGDDLPYSVKDFLDKVLNLQIVTKNKLELVSSKKLIKEIIVENNSWLETYDRDKFFGIKDGIPTIETKYGKNAELLTVAQEMVIVEYLKTEKIPLTTIVVKNAFKEFFNNNLFEYVCKLKEYSEEFEEELKKEENTNIKSIKNRISL